MTRYRVRIVLVVAFALAAAGCGIRGKQPVPPPAEPGTVLVTPAPAKLKFSVTITPPRFALGERVALEASMFNEGEKAFEHSFATSCMWDYDVTTEDGRSVGPVRPCAPEKTELRLEAGELRMIMRNWSGRDHYFGTSENLPAGRYRVTAGLVDETGRVIPMMEPVEIEIVAKRP